MTFTPFLCFNGTAEEAMNFYAGVFGATDLNLMRFSDAPAEANMGASDRIMYSQFTAGGQTLGAWDYPESMEGPAQASVMVGHWPATVEEGQRVFDRLAEGGNIRTPFGHNFFSPGFGMLTDRFGTNWVISVPGG